MPEKPHANGIFYDLNEDGIDYDDPVTGGSVRLIEISGRLDAGLVPQTTQMAIACLALASMLLVHRHARFRPPRR